MMKRLHFFLEGQTEETFLRDMLVPHFAGLNIKVDGRLIAQKKTALRKYKGGIVDFEKTYKDMLRWIKEDDNLNSWFTTMYDLYALPDSFPKYAEAKQNEPYERVAVLEKALADKVDYVRFVPYLQLHEFEALLLADPQQLIYAYPSQNTGIAKLIQELRPFDNPELIDDHPDSAPSKRIIVHIPEYEGDKASSGPIVAKHIGLVKLRGKCRHFNEWLTKLEKIRAAN